MAIINSHPHLPNFVWDYKYYHIHKAICIKWTELETSTTSNDSKSNHNKNCTVQIQWQTDTLANEKKTEPRSNLSNWFPQTTLGKLYVHMQKNKQNTSSPSHCPKTTPNRLAASMEGLNTVKSWLKTRNMLPIQLLPTFPWPHKKEHIIHSTLKEA